MTPVSQALLSFSMVRFPTILGCVFVLFRALLPCHSSVVGIRGSLSRTPSTSASPPIDHLTELELMPGFSGVDSRCRCDGLRPIFPFEDLGIHPCICQILACYLDWI